jgi:hypothetical protein
VFYLNALDLLLILLLLKYSFVIDYTSHNLSDVKVFVAIALSVVSILLSMNDAIIWSLVVQNLASE